MEIFESIILDITHDTYFLHCSVYFCRSSL